MLVYVADNKRGEEDGIRRNERTIHYILTKQISHARHNCQFWVLELRYRQSFAQQAIDGVGEQKANVVISQAW